MTYLLDVNALIAHGYQGHEFHERLAVWLKSEPTSRLATCAITELGFLRILTNSVPFGISVATAREILRELKSDAEAPIRFLSDGVDASQLPAWVRGPKQLTDGHLLALAQEHGATFATLDSGIPGAFLIPNLP